MYRRISKFKEVLKERKLEGGIICKPENRKYMSGFTGSSGYVLITTDKAFFITDFRYIQQATKECSECEIIEHNDKHTIYSILKDLNLKSLGFEEDFITYSQYKEFNEKLNNTKFIPLDGAISSLRTIKYEEEVTAIEKAASIADNAFKHICGYIKQGITEKEVAIELEFYMKRKGASATSFDTIVASGVRSSLPHGIASDKVIQKGDFITMDFGCIYNGYCSDMTRTVVLGKANDKQKEIYHIVLEAQMKALEAIKPEIDCAGIDKIARDIIRSKGYGEYFGHGLGHGVGLEVHENPRVSPSSNDLLKPGMVVTDEPGIYIPDFGGVRIEDLVLVTQTNHKVLSKSPKELIEL